MVISLRRYYFPVVAALLTAVMGLTVIAGARYFAEMKTETQEALELPIIMYHEIKYYKTGRDVIMPWEFESDLRYLRDHGYHTVTMTQLIRYTDGGYELPEKPIILSFDDGYLNTYEYALPLLEEYGMSIVLSVIGKNTDDFTSIPDSNLDYSHVTWDQLYEMLESGRVDVQNHTYNLHSLSGRVGCVQLRAESREEYERILSDDLLKLQNECAVNLGWTPNTFTYPFGRYNEASEEIIRKLGFRATMTCDYGVNLITRDPDSLYGLKRIRRAHGDSLGALLKEAEKTVKR